MFYRFADIEDNRLCNVATLLDPRFKSRFLKEAAVTEAKAGIILAAVRLLTNRSDVEGVELETSVEVEGAHPPTKRRCVAETTSTLWNCFDDMVEEEATTVTSSTSTLTINDSVNEEVSDFLQEPLLNRCDDPAIWWKHNKIRYQALSNVAQIYLAPPSTSVPSERLFSVAGDVISEHRARLNSENAEKLIFSKYNASLIS